MTCSTVKKFFNEHKFYCISIEQLKQRWLELKCRRTSRLFSQIFLDQENFFKMSRCQKSYKVALNRSAFVCTERNLSNVIAESLLVEDLRLTQPSVSCLGYKMAVGFNYSLIKWIFHMFHSTQSLALIFFLTSLNLFNNTALASQNFKPSAKETSMVNQYFGQLLN